jgi:transposase
LPLNAWPAVQSPRRAIANLEAHQKVHLHFTPTYSSRLNQVELWFSKIERHHPGRVHFAPGLEAKTDALHPRKYFDPMRRIISQSVVTGH